MIIGIDIGGTYFRIGSYENKVYSLIEKYPVRDILKEKDEYASLCLFLKEYIGKKKVEAISIGFPSTINKERTKILQAPNLKGLEGVDLVSSLKEDLGTEVFLEKDTSLLLIYDKKKYGIPDEGMTIAIYFGTGIGCAMMINGSFFKGRNGTAGEIGHLVADSDDTLCGCGNKGCYEALASGTYLKKLCQERNRDLESVFESYQNEEVIKKMIDRQGALIADVENLLDPDHVLIGGGILTMKAYPKDLLLERIREHVRKPLPMENMHLVFTEDEKEKGVFGAIEYALIQLKKENR